MEVWRKTNHIAVRKLSQPPHNYSDKSQLLVDNAMPLEYFLPLSPHYKNWEHCYIGTGLKRNKRMRRKKVRKLVAEADVFRYL